MSNDTLYRRDWDHPLHRSTHPGDWAAIAPIPRANDIRLIADEVVTGFGRLGTMFGSDHVGLDPDFTTIAKG